MLGLPLLVCADPVCVRVPSHLHLSNVAVIHRVFVHKMSGEGVPTVMARLDQEEGSSIWTPFSFSLVSLIFFRLFARRLFPTIQRP